MLEAVSTLFPRFRRIADKFRLEHTLPPATPTDVANLETRLGLSLPQSYKALLQCARGFWLMGGIVQFGPQHPFFHNFPPLESLTLPQRRAVEMKRGPLPPASQGMLCFAEFFMEADGDQVLFDVAGGLVKGEYPVMYWAHEGRPPSVRKLADTFAEFMEAFLEYPEFREEDG
ncbi:MAG: SMI1/KNR4 family protein [Pirellulales bacterium]